MTPTTCGDSKEWRRSANLFPRGGVGASELGADRYGLHGPCMSPAVPALRFGRAAHFSLLGLALMLTDCAVGPDFQAPVLPALKRFLPGGRESLPGTTLVRGADI